MPSIDLDTLLAAARDASLAPAEAQALIGMLDLTSLSGSETAAEIENLCRTAVDASVAAVCVYPAFVTLAKPHLASHAIKLAAVANFPDGSDDIARAVDEGLQAISGGAQEIDVVAPLDAIEAGDVGIVGELVDACREAFGPAIAIKLILETGRLERPDVITAAARSAVMAGVTMLKTSTGKVPVGATLEAAAALLSVIQESDGRVGLKVSGGVRTAADAAGYRYLVAQMMGEDWLKAENFRIGASSLLADLQRAADAAR